MIPIPTFYVRALELPRVLQQGVSVELAGVRRVFPGAPAVLDDFTLRVAAGDFLAILGPSGCGKSTLLRMIAGLAKPDAGRIDLDPTPRTAFVFQDAHLLPWRTVLDNAGLPLELQGVDSGGRHRAASAALDQVGLADAASRYPAQLSGGMRMRVSIARALVTNPTLLLMDEPFAALDEITRFHLEEQLRALWQKRGMTILFVTHSISEAAFLANRAIVLARRGGAILHDQTFELPQDRSHQLRADARLAAYVQQLYQCMEEE
jgi:NitT/TauT family transport system ATP-binding protein